jgi:hypothetical protein
MTRGTTEMIELAERCEQATGPDDDLDCAIHEQFGGTPQIAPGHRWSSTPRYTVSLDAAMTLVPGIDWEWSLEWESGSLLYHPDIEQFARAKIGDPTLRMDAECVTPALALCAAALRARAAQARETKP